MSVRLYVSGMLAVGLALSACQVRKSANPLSPSVAGPIPGVSITTPALSVPATGARISSAQQPITLTVDNATTSGVRPLSYRFEVAGDAAFATIVAMQEGIAPDPGGKTSLRLSTTLPDRTYFWRARAQDGANTGNFAGPFSFTVFTPVVFQAPVLVSPAEGEVVTSLTPRLVINNAARTGPATSVQYSVALYAEAFTHQALQQVWTVAEAPGAQTTFDIPSGVLQNGKQYFWFAFAVDPTAQGPYSGPRSFRTPALSGGGGGGGDGTGGGGGTASDFASLGPVTIVGGSPDVRGFAVTSRITALRFSPGNIHLQHTKAGQWTPVDIGGALQESTLWVFFRINGQWYAAGGERWRPGQTDKALSAPSAIGSGWFYNANWAPMTGYVPRPGETVGFMVVAGSTRADARTPVRERSPILLVPFPADGANVSFP